MRIAFYAPLKSPEHPVPSGDRRMGRLLIEALHLARHEVELACNFSSRDGSGDLAHQQQVKDRASMLAQRLVQSYRTRPAAQRPQVWLTYHLYHKAPDWIGPVVAQALAIPYVVVEASVADKRKGGPWDLGYRATIEALKRARLVIGINGADRAGVLPHLSDPTRLVALPPFVDRTPFEKAADNRDACRRSLSTRYRLSTRWPWLLAVGMLRFGAKLESYRLLATALAKVDAAPHILVIVGDGPARAEVRQLFEPFGEQVMLVGQEPEAQIAAWCAAADLMVWPAIDEAYGMALLEAQATGLPVVAGASGGVPEIVRHEVTGLTPPPGDADAFAAAINVLLGDSDKRADYGIAAREICAKEHDLFIAARRLDTMLAGL
ncbi:MAG TPA: glycosyltransferase family 4 protein [Candidatus Sulfotelmatobacter sp.]|nr:glycosyltransferase family 4 protein [Candidatus Sulfotelmatobacter sp.]